MYSELSSDLWQKNIKIRPDFSLAVRVISEMLPSGQVLDVGCFRGEFLSMLSKDYQKYGVEPSEAAQEVALERGIILLGASIEQIDKHSKFHVITLIDGIEHLPDPFCSLQKLSSLLLPDGILIIATGNTDSLLWRLLGTDYWYYLTEQNAPPDIPSIPR
jgi:2-polyprenyl-3-methyl-5-hydroxy-6-metoxy-1,4-benzoquinol methylase